MKNKIRKIYRNCKAVSPIIATLLLIAISVAAAVVTYTFVMNMTANQGSQAQTAVRIDDVQLGQGVSAGGIRTTTVLPISTTTTLYVASSSAAIIGITSNTFTLGSALTDIPTGAPAVAIPASTTVASDAALATSITVASASGFVVGNTIAVTDFGSAAIIGIDDDTDTFTLGSALTGTPTTGKVVAIVASTTVLPISTTTTLYVASASGFVVGDSITVGSFGSAAITGISGTTFTLGSALTGTPTGSPAVTILINAAKISIRNTGTVPVVIQTIYIYQGSTQLFVKDQIGYALGAGTVKSLGLINTDSSNFGTLTVKSAGITLTDPTQYVYVGTAWSTDLVASKAYTIKIVTDNGFNIEGVYYAPTSFGP